jgi:ATP-binding cassette subfamily F protein uup
MHYVSAENVTKSFGVKPLFSNLSFHVSEGDKIALIARNGTGKSTLLRILAGKEFEDSGKIWVSKDVDIALFEQNPEFLEKETILQNIFFHDHPIMNAIREYELSMETEDYVRQGEAIIKMDEMGAWDFDAKVQQILGKLNIHNLEQVVNTLSGGQRKRVALARTLIDIGFEHKHILPYYG